MNRTNWGEPACSEQSVCWTSRYKARTADDLQEVVRPHSTLEAWNLVKYLLSRGITWDSVEGRRRRQTTPLACLPHVNKSDTETFVILRDFRPIVHRDRRIKWKQNWNE